MMTDGEPSCLTCSPCSPRSRTPDADLLQAWQTVIALLWMNYTGVTSIYSGA